MVFGFAEIIVNLHLTVLVRNKLLKEFAHGSSLENIQGLIKNGLNSSKAKANSSGGRVNRPGSWFAIPLPQDGAIQVAYEFGLRKSDKPAILIMGLPEDIHRQLEDNGDAFSRPIAGQETLIETIFRPSSFDRLNDRAEFLQIIDPYERL